MRNRYGDEYHWEKLNDKKYRFVMEGKSLDHCRIGGKEGQEKLDPNDLGMFDPSGGPFVSVGDLLEGKKINRIRSTDEGFVVEVE
jgi:hypothetical protein